MDRESRPNKKAAGSQWRQGDVQIIRVKGLPPDCTPLKGRKELAFGEATGHAHRIDRGTLHKAKDGGLFLEVRESATVTHEEHKAKTLVPGIYRVNIKRQYTPTGWRHVLD